MNFFDSACQEPARKDDLFGLCDDQDGTKAYTNTDDSSKWVATVKNDSKVELTFTAIDNCVIMGNEEQGRGRCDGMLTSIEHIYFVELKNQKEGWIADAIVQLESTIRFFMEHHDISRFRYKKAFACNKRHRPFVVIQNEISKSFFENCGFHIHVGRFMSIEMSHFVEKNIHFSSGFSTTSRLILHFLDGLDPQRSGCISRAS